MVARTLTYALVASLAANAALGWSWLGQRDAATAARLQRDQARGDASACSDAVEDLRELADKRGQAATAARRAAASAAQDLAARADHTLRQAPSNPADTCASMQTLGDEWLQGRGAR